MEEVDRKVKQGTIKKLTVAAHLVHVGGVTKWVVMQKCSVSINTLQWVSFRA